MKHFEKWRREIAAKIAEALAKEGSRLSEQAIDLMGYTVCRESGWLVKKYKDGTVIRIRKIDKK